MKQVTLYSAVAAAILMSTMTTANVQENSTLDTGRLALAGYGDEYLSYISKTSAWIPKFNFNTSHKKQGENHE